MIKDNDSYIFTIDNDTIRNLSALSLTDDECEEVAYEIDCLFDRFVKDTARKWRVENPATHLGLPSVTAYVVLQSERADSDYLYTVEEVTFDCASALNAFALSDLPEDGDFHGTGALNFGDDVYYECVRLALCVDWDGPFEFYISDEDEFNDYIEARKAMA